jgi:hypothetical protein
MTVTGARSSRSYWGCAQAGGGPFDPVGIPTVPVAVIVPMVGSTHSRGWGRAILQKTRLLEQSRQGVAILPPGSSPTPSPPRFRLRSGHCIASAQADHQNNRGRGRQAGRTHSTDISATHRALGGVLMNTATFGRLNQDRRWRARRRVRRGLSCHMFNLFYFCTGVLIR